MLSAPAWGIDEAHTQRAEEAIARAAGYLKSRQDETTGGWAVNPRGPQFPAITGLVVQGLAGAPGVGAADESVIRGARYMLTFRQPDGGIYDQVLACYNTSICLSALAKLGQPMPEVIPAAQSFLRGLQYGEGAVTDGPTGKETMKVGPEHPYYGGVGYGKHNRPDNSNLAMMLEALHDTGVKGDDEAFKRATIFLARTQMYDAVNDQPYADGSAQGGFIYATVDDDRNMGTGGNEDAGMVEETTDDGQKVSRLRAYGSMTYAGFKSYIYADLPPDDERVKAAAGWIRRNYTVEENPGLGTDGVYYYLLTFARAMDAAGRRGGSERVDTITITRADGSAEERDWANDLIDRLAGLQNEDGSFRSLDDRWMEDNPVLITAYALIALEAAAK
jgi:squalene-hopene/tetraprenyl-beta-curcumene cyclase